MLTQTGDRPQLGQDTSPPTEPVRLAKRNTRRERRLWHEPDQKMGPLGCGVCPDRGTCGGLRLQAHFYDCLQFCCGKPECCDRVCRNHPDFADRVREVGTFELGTVPRSQLLVPPALPVMVPVLYHRTARAAPATCDAVAIPLYEMFDRRTGLPRFTTHEELCARFGVRPGTTIILTGTDRDPPLERWWGLGEERRTALIRAMNSAGIALVTTPNYSLFTDRPRQDDLHAMKRIAIVHEEFLREGMPAALHTNGRTDADFARWASYVAGRPEITHIAYEFTTGTGRAGRREQHASWLAALAADVGRPLHLIMRGGSDVLPELAGAFAGVTVLDTSIFMKTMKRRRAYPKSNAALGWERAPTPRGTPVDDLFIENTRTVESWLRNLTSAPDTNSRVAG